MSAEMDKLLTEREASLSREYVILKLKDLIPDYEVSEAGPFEDLWSIIRVRMAEREKIAALVDEMPHEPGAEVDYFRCKLKIILSRIQQYQQGQQSEPGALQSEMPMDADVAPELCYFCRKIHAGPCEGRPATEGSKP